MKSPARFVFLLLAFSSVAFAQEDPEVREFQRLEIAWSEAIRDQDREALEEFLAPEYTLTVAQSDRLGVTDRATWLKNATEGYKLHEFAFKEIVVRRYGNVAVVSSFYTQQATVNGRDRSGDAFLTDVWEKVGGKWRVSARFSSSPKTSNARMPPNNSFKVTPDGAPQFNR
jgi:ketosteroid isomerase-like protein